MTHPLQATLENRGDRWVLTFTRELAHPIETVWPWLTDPDKLRRWSPVVPDRAFDSLGARQVRENPGDDPVDGEVLVMDPPRELVHRWGPDVLHWRLTPTDTGCRLTFEHELDDRDRAAGNAAGWHICFDVLAGNLDGTTSERVCGNAAMEHGWPQLREGYAELLGV